MDLAIAIIAAVAAVAGFLVRTRYWPYGPCPRCAGRRGRGFLSRPRAYNRCGRCDGGERIRPLSMIWPRWREEAARRKKAREKRP